MIVWVFDDTVNKLYTYQLIDVTDHTQFIKVLGYPEFENVLIAQRQCNCGTYQSQALADVLDTPTAPVGRRRRLEVC